MRADVGSDLVAYFRRQERAALALLRRLVELESPTGYKRGVDQLGLYLAKRCSDLGAKVKVFEQERVGNHICLEVDAGGPGQALILGHLDTVWPRGEVRLRPFKIEEGRAYGPGVLDMKASLVLVYLLIRAVSEQKVRPARPLFFLLNSDEETGSETSRRIIEAKAERSDYVLVLEPPLPGNRLKTARKGVARFDLLVRGVAAHAGVDHEKGVNAIEELARQVLRLQAMTDYSRGVTVNVGVVSGGTAANVVPAEARAEIDLRLADLEQGAAVIEQIMGLKPVNPRAEITITGGLNRPPLERSAAVVRLYQKARELAAELGFSLGEGATGGGSDGCFTAALGIPTLDGLGVDGQGPHALNEHIIISDIPFKAALISRLVETL